MKCLLSAGQPIFNNADLKIDIGKIIFKNSSIESFNMSITGTKNSSYSIGETFFSRWHCWWR